MSSRREENESQGARFPEAVAQWRLALRTEVKNASSLPTAMFHTRDPMLETLLAEANVTMLAHLHERTAQVAAAPEGEVRIEVVEPDELRRVSARLREPSADAVGVDDHRTAENLVVLADACLDSHEAAARGAAWLLRRQFGIDPVAAPDVAALELLQGLQDNLHEVPAAAEALAALCHRIAAAVAGLAGDGGGRP